MKEQLHYLRTLLLVLCMLAGVQGTWADETIFSAVGSTTASEFKSDASTAKTYSMADYGTYSVSGTSLDVCVCSSTASAQKLFDATNKFCIAASSSSLYYILNFNTKLVAGDKITFKGYATSANESTPLGLKFSASTDFKTTYASTTTTTAKSWTELSYTIQNGDALIGKTTIYVTRNSGIGTYFDSLTITRPEATKHTVTFNAGDHGTCATPSLKEASVGAGITLPSVTPATGYEFLGWATTSTATTADAGAEGVTYNPTVDCTLYALYDTSSIMTVSGTKTTWDFTQVTKNKASKLKGWTEDTDKKYFSSAAITKDNYDTKPTWCDGIAFGAYNNNADAGKIRIYINGGGIYFYGNAASIKVTIPENASTLEIYASNNYLATSTDGVTLTWDADSKKYTATVTPGSTVEIHRSVTSGVYITKIVTETLCNWTAKTSTGLSLGSGTSVQGEAVTVSYPLYINVNGTLYTKARQSSSPHYGVSFTPDKDNYEYTAEYTATDITNVVYCSEGENITGASICSASSTNIGIRSSNQNCGYAESDITLINLSAGTYKAYSVVYSNSSAGTTVKLQAGTQDAIENKVEGASNWTSFTNEFTLTEAADFKWLASGNSKNGLDFIYIQKVPTYTITKGTTHENGDFTITPSGDQAEGTTITLKATPDSGYVLDSWSVYKTGDASTTLEVTNNTFTMPAYAVTVDATFKSKAIDKKTTDTTVDIAGAFDALSPSKADAGQGTTPNNWSITTTDQNGAFHVDTWASLEGKGNMTTPYFERWVETSSTDLHTLNACTMSTTLTGLNPKSIYEVSALVRVYDEAGTNEPDKVNFFVGGNSVDVCSGNTTTLYKGFYDTYTVQGITDADGNLTVGIEVLKDTKASWVSWKDFTLHYVSARPETTVTLLFDNTTESSTTLTYRIPAIAVDPNGKLYVFSDKRYGTGDVGKNAIDILERTSGDDGYSWTTATEAIKYSGTSGFDYAHGDAAVVADREGKGFLLMCASGSIGYDSSTRNSPIRVGKYTSSDGVTWSSGTDVTTDIYKINSNITKAFFSSGRICQSRFIKVGSYYRLYAAMCTNLGSVPVYSDDFGTTWKQLGSTVPASSGDEAKIEELPNGNVLISCKPTSEDINGRYFNIFTYTSKVSAAGAWSTVATSNSSTGGTYAQANITNGEILIVPATKDNKDVYVALQSVPKGSGRNNLVVYYKVLSSQTDFDYPTDFSTGWSVGKQINSTTTCYSTMVLDNNGDIAFVYEENFNNSGYDIKFRTLTLSELTGSTCTYNAGLLDEATNNAYLGITTVDDLVGKVVTLKCTGTTTSSTSFTEYVYNNSNVIGVQTTTPSGTTGQFLVAKGFNGGYTFQSVSNTEYYLGVSTGNMTLETSPAEFLLTKSNRSSKATTTAETMKGYALQYFCPANISSEDNGVVFVAVSSAASSGTANPNRYGYTTKGNSGWSTDFTIEPVAYNVTCETNASGCTVTPDNSKPENGATVTLTITPADGYKLYGFTVDGTDYSASVIGNEFTFTMPAHDVTVSAKFAKSVGSATVAVSQTIQTDYTAQTFTIDYSTITKELGCSTSDLLPFYTYDQTGNIYGTYTANKGYWYDNTGKLTTYGSSSAFYIEYYDISTGTFSVGQMQNYYADIKTDQTATGQIIFIYGSKYYVVNVAYTVQCTGATNITVKGDADDTTIESALNALGDKKTDNSLVIVEGSYTGTKDNVIVKNDQGTYECNNFVLTDKVAMTVPTEFTATKASYTRAAGNAWGTLCLPYPIAYDASSNVKYYKLVSASFTDSNATLNLSEYTDEVPANTPVLYKSGSGDTAEALTVEASAVTINTDGAGSQEGTESTTWVLKGVYTPTAVYAQGYKAPSVEGYTNVQCSQNAYYIKSNQFYHLTSYIKTNPFRAYIDVDEAISSAKQGLVMNFRIDGESTTDIDAIGISNALFGEDVEVYDVNGRKLDGMQKGINIINGKKVIK